MLSALPKKKCETRYKKHLILITSSTTIQYHTLSMKYKATALCLILISLDFQSFL